MSLSLSLSVSPTLKLTSFRTGSATRGGVHRPEGQKSRVEHQDPIHHPCVIIIPSQKSKSKPTNQPTNQPRSHAAIKRRNYETTKWKDQIPSKLNQPPRIRPGLHARLRTGDCLLNRPSVFRQTESRREDLGRERDGVLSHGR